MYARWNVWRQFSFQHVGPGDWTQVIRLGGKWPYSLSLLAGPKSLLWFLSLNWPWFTNEGYMAAPPGHTGMAQGMVTSWLNPKSSVLNFQPQFPTFPVFEAPSMLVFWWARVSEGWCSGTHFWLNRASFREFSKWNKSCQLFLFRAGIWKLHGLPPSFLYFFLIYCSWNLIFRG